MYRMTDAEYKKFSERVAFTPTDCVVWIRGKTDKGYGQMTVRGKVCYAHILSYRYFVGEIPEGYEIDHLCRNPPCINAEHLEAVTPWENMRRGIGPSAMNSRKTACDKGHPYIGYNLIIDSQGARQCRECRNERWLRNYYKRNSKPLL